MNKTQQAANTAAQLVTDTAHASDERISDIVTGSIRDFFNQEQDNKRFLDVARIPFICDDIKQIKDDVRAIYRLIYMAVGIMTIISLLAPFFLKSFFK